MKEPAAVVCENCGAPGYWTSIYDEKEVPLCLDCASLRAFLTLVLGS